MLASFADRNPDWKFTAATPCRGDIPDNFGRAVRSDGLTITSVAVYLLLRHVTTRTELMTAAYAQLIDDGRGAELAEQWLAREGLITVDAHKAVRYAYDILSAGVSIALDTREPEG